MTFAQLRILQAVARTGNMTRAAELLGTTQSAVSHALSGLERELGVTMFVRRPGGATLTAAGRAVSRRAALILTQLDGLHQDAAATRGRAGSLRIGVIPSVNARLLPRVLRAFATGHERTGLAVFEGSDAEVLEWACTGAVDVAAVTAGDPRLHTVPLARDRLLAVLPAAHRLSARETVSLPELARDPFIMSTGGCEPLITALAERAGIRLRTHYQVRDVTSILGMVAARLGVTIMPELSVPADESWVRTLPLDPDERRTVLLGRPADAAPSPEVTAFIDTAVREVDPEYRLPRAG